MGLRAAELLAMYTVDEGPLEKSLGSIPGKVAKVAGIIGGGLAIGDALSQSLDQARLQDKLAAQLGATGKQSAELGKIAGQLYASNYGDSLEQVNEAIRGVVNNIGDFGQQTGGLDEVSGKVLNLASAFGVDLNGATAAVGQMLRTGLAKSADEALNVLTVGFQIGNDKAGDLLDTINEYGTQFRKLGLDGTTAMGLISQGLQAGARDSDIVADAIKEFSIRAVDGSQTTAQGFQMIGLDAQKMAEQIAAGGPAAQAGLQTVLDHLRAIHDPALQAQAAVALFGTQAEDLGAALYALDPSQAVTAMGDVAGAADKMGQTLNDNASSNLEQFKRSAMQGIVNVLGGYVVPAVTAVSGVLVGKLGPALSWVGGVISNDVAPIVRDVFGFVADHQTAFTVLAAILAGILVPALIGWAVSSTTAAAANVAAWTTTQVGAIASSWAQVGAVARVVAGWVVMGVESLANAAMMAAAWVIAMGPVGWVIAAVVGLVALIVANWDTVKSWTIAAWSAVSGAVGAAWDWIKGAVSAALDWVVNLFLHWTLIGLIISHWDQIKSAFSNGVSAAVEFVKSLPGRVLAALGDLGSLLWNAGKSMIQGLIDGAGSLLRNIGHFFLNLLPGWIRGPFESVLGISSPSKVFAEYGRNIGQGLIGGLQDMRPAVAAEMMRLADSQAFAGLTVRAPVGVAGGTAAGAAGGASAAGAAAGGIGSLVSIGEYHAAPNDDPNATAQKLAVLARTGGAG